MYSPLVGINGNVLTYYQVMMYVQTNKEPRSESDVCNVVGGSSSSKINKSHGKRIYDASIILRNA